MDEIKNNISQNILKHRKRLNLSQKELAKELGIKNLTTISSWERGANLPNIETILKLCEFFKIDINEMYGTKEIISFGESVNRFERFIEYLKSLDYSFESEVSRAHYEEVIDDFGKVIGRAQIADDCNAILIKNEKSAVFSSKEFDQLQFATKEVIDIKFYKKLMEQENQHK